MRRWAWLPVALALSFVLAACSPKSGGAKGPSPSPGGIVKTDFLASGNAICTGLTQQLNTLPDPGTDPAKQLANVNGLVSIYQASLAQLRVLPEPHGDETTLRALFAKVDAFIALAKQEGAALSAGSPAVPQSLVDQTTAANMAASTAFNDYGLAACAP
ncbi:MAG: hypothetical protein NVSMB32_16030 [Actinomycetota bacterium]